MTDVGDVSQRGPAGERPVADLVRQLSEQLSVLVRDEIRLAQRVITIRIFEEPAEGREPDLLDEIQSEWFLATGDTIILEGDRFATVTEARRTFSVPTSSWSQVVYTKDALNIPG